jgi:hypothetical protein
MQEEHLCELGLQWLSRRHVIIFISILSKIQSPPIKVQKVFTYTTQQLCKKNQIKGKKPKW